MIVAIKKPPGRYTVRLFYATAAPLLLALALLGSAARRVRSLAVFKFARFDPLHGREARSKPKFSVAVAAVAIAAVAAVAAAAVAIAAVAVAAVAIAAVIVTAIAGVA